MGEIGKIVVTTDSLIDKDDFKLSRKKIVGRILSGEFTLIDEGNGLGLALVKRIVDFHGGEVKAENLDKGYRFTVILR